MRILIFNTLYYPKKVGGAEVCVQNFAERLNREGHRVYVITTSTRRSVERVGGVIVIRIKQRNIFSTYENKPVNNFLKSVWHLLDSCNPFNSFLISRLLKRIRPDAVHTNNIQGFSPMIWTVVKRRRIPLVHTFRDYYLLCHKTTLYHQQKHCTGLCWQCRMTHSIKKKFWKYPDVYTGVSRFIVEKHAAYLPLESKRQQVIYDVIDLPPATRERPLGKKLVFGFIGRISQAKGAEYLARELGKIQRSYIPQFKIVLAGKGDEQFIDRLKYHLNGIEFEFPGFVNADDFYRSIDVLIVPSLWNEPFGMIVIEALSQSVPVCLARSGGLQELHNDNCTWSYEPEEGVLCRRIEHIITNRTEIEEKKPFCREHAERFAPIHHDKKYLDLFYGLSGSVN